MWYSSWGHQQSSAFCSARLVGSRDLLDASTSVDFPFRQFLSPTTLTTQHAATVGDHDGTRGPERRRGGAGGCTGRAYKVCSLFILIFSTKLTVPPFPQPQSPENALTRHPWPPTAQPHMSQTLPPPLVPNTFYHPLRLLPPRLPSPSYHPDTKNATTGSHSWCLGSPLPLLPPRHQECNHRVAFFVSGDCPPPPTTQT